MIELIQKRGTGAQSELIEEITDSPWSHTAIRFLAPFNGMDAHGDPVEIKPGNVIEAWSPFVRRTDTIAAGHAAGTVVDVFQLRQPLEQKEFEVAARFWCRQIGKPYGWKDCAARIPGARHFLKPPDGGLTYWQYDEWFCSELAAAGLELAGRHLFNFRKAWKIEPGLLPESLLFDQNYRTEVV